jgi:diaminopimelate epimerase
MGAMKFTKMHGIGNDYVYVNGFDERVAEPSRLAVAVSNRHFGVGGDGLILILPSDKADVRMRMFNADGSEAEMCGNGVRCVAKYAFDHGLSKNNPMRVQTGRGVLTLSLDVSGGKVRQVTVNMGEPILELAKIPVNSEHAESVGSHIYRVREELAHGAGESIDATFVSMGNPHAVVFTDSWPDDDYLREKGSLFERARAFPKRVNLHWVKVQSRSEVSMETWERGSGITLACGTGACAVCVAGVLTGRTDRKLLAHLPGGDLRLEWRESDNCVYMAGPATEVFSGEGEFDA